MRPWCSPSRRREAARAGRAPRRSACGRPGRRRGFEWLARASSTSGSPTASGRRSSAVVLAARRRLRPLDGRQGAQGQRRIRVGQPDRADACRPLPRRRGGRCDRQHAGLRPAIDVTREYYINDAGAQVEVLARSAYLRYREALGEAIGEIPPGLYPGDYLKPVGEALAGEFGAACSDAGERGARRRAGTAPSTP